MNARMVRRAKPCVAFQFEVVGVGVSGIGGLRHSFQIAIMVGGF
jgi:hypothetical protein